MNDKIKLLAVVLAAIVLLIGALTYRAVTSLEDARLDSMAPPVVVHGIETSWRSQSGGHRLWSLTPGGGDYRPWLEEHIAVVKTAETLMPMKEK